MHANKFLLCKNLVYQDLRLFYGGERGHFLFSLILSLAEPLALILVYIFVFSKVLGTDSPDFGVFVAVGYLHWQLTVSGVTSACTSVIGRPELVKFASFDRIQLPIATLLFELWKFLLTILVTAAICLCAGSRPWAGLVFYPLVLALNCLFILGLSLGVSSAQVLYRDTRGVVNLVFRIVFWCTPIVYSSKLVPEFYANILFYINPLISFLSCYRSLLVSQELPSLLACSTAAAWSILSAFLGFKLFRQLEGNFADEL